MPKARPSQAMATANPEAMHYLAPQIAYGHYEDPLPELAACRLCQDPHGKLYKCSGYRLLHWSPHLNQGTNHLQKMDVRTVLEVAAVISYFTSKSIRPDTESSNLLLLAPFVKTNTFPHRLDEFALQNHMSNLVRPTADKIALITIYEHIRHDIPLLAELSQALNLQTVVSMALDYSKACLLLNTVKAIGIGGTALFHQNLRLFNCDSVQEFGGFDRSKGLSVVLLPTTDNTRSFLHFFRTMCAYRQQVKSKKPGVFQSRNETNPKQKHKTKKHAKGRHQKTK